MNASPVLSLSSSELAGLVRAVDPAALLVPARILRRVIKKHRGLGGLGLNVPHARCYAIDRDTLLRIAGRGELGLAAGSSLADVVLLLPRPENVMLRQRPPGEVLRDAWRLLFHGEVDRALTGRTWSAPELRQRIEGIGRVSFEEARAVLRQENDLFDPDDDAEVYREFAAVYLELRLFDPHRLGQFFPTVLDPDAVDAILAADVDATPLLERTRPAGAVGPVLPPHAAEPAPPPAVPAGPESARPGELRAQADEVSRRGNQVKAAILRYKALQLAPPTQAGSLRGSARGEIDQLAARLERALRFPASERPDWARCLTALLEPASRGFWPVEARLLYDLQKVCLDNERDLYAVDMVEWFVSWFRRPIKRHLPDQPLVLTVEHLRSALARLTVAHVGDEERLRLRELLESALHHAEEQLRTRLRPRLVESLDAVALMPRNAAERFSRDRLVEELLDRVAERHFLSMGDLRDALSRSRIKLPDLRGPIEFFVGDSLLRCNRLLAVAMDGVYRRGEIYLRWLQRLTSLFFANPVGRWLTLYLLLPALGSVFIIKGLNELFELAHKHLHLPHVAIPEFDGISYLALALFLLPMLHWPAFRRGVLRGLHFVWLGVRGLVHDLPAAILRLPVVRLVLQSRAYLFFYQFLGKPLACTLPVTAVLWLVGAEPEWTWGLSAGVLVLASVVINTPLGLLAEETTTDWLVRTWQLIRDDLVPGLFRFIIYLFNRFKERVERIIYTVDEWLRFRSGESTLSLAVKAVLGLVWSVVTYVVRFGINLLLEPQINPIKHFPVVTVSHKFLLPLTVPAGAGELSPLGSVAASVFGLGVRRANRLAFFVVFGMPGIFGFLAWELKENWRLYRANASPTLDPEMVGSHGEQVIQLMRPGFHSGTLPKLYARLRSASGKAERKREEGLHHVEEGMRHFVERELVDVLRGSANWNLSASLAVGEVWLGTNRIRCELCCAGLAGASVLLDLAHQAGRLVASVARTGWLDALTDSQRAVFTTALTGLYKKAGVDLVREHLQAVLPAGVVVDLRRDGLFVWADADRTRGGLYDLDRPEAAVQAVDGGLDVPGHTRDVLFSAQPVAWSAWVEAWERDQAGKEQEPLVPGFVLLPPVPPAPEGPAGDPVTG
jgi:hypothetical protein